MCRMRSDAASPLLGPRSTRLAASSPTTPLGGFAVDRARALVAGLSFKQQWAPHAAKTGAADDGAAARLQTQAARDGTFAPVVEVRHLAVDRTRLHVA